MILFFNPRATKPKNRRYPLSVLALAAMIEGKEEYAIIDGNIDDDPRASIDRVMRERAARLLAVTVMPGPQMVAALPVCRWFKDAYPQVPVVWGGYFPSLYPDAALNAGYVDFVVRGQGEDTFVELLASLENGRQYTGIRGLSFKDQFGLHVHNPERPLRSPGDFPAMPYHRLDPEQYLRPTFLGSRTTVHQASIGCPYQCNFCGVVPFSGAREKVEPPARTAAILGQLRRDYGANAVQFYDNNFFLREDHARELAERMIPLRMHWWCETRVDAVLRFSDDTLRKIRESGCVMIFFGVESGSNRKLKEMKKEITAEQSLELAARIRQFDIVPEFSLIFGDPRDSESDFHETVAFARRVKRINPDVEIVVQTYVPVPQRRGQMYGNLDGFEFPTTPEEWATERWFNFAIRKDPELRWLPPELRRKIQGFETVMNARWPTVQDWRLPAWGRWMLKGLGSWRYALGAFDNPFELRWAQKLVRLRQPRLESL
ncbi:MAG: B12-binding domain-containing radical SAM protein [Acidobacteria bacterium]|nr:MAG: B12-binding domain-containing radical SAM protein [Acidobacteriota bacterium]